MQKNPPKLLSYTFTPSLPFCLFLSPHASPASSSSGWSSPSPPASSPSIGARSRHGCRRPLELVAAAPGARGLRARRPHLEFATFAARRPWLAAPSAPPWPPCTPKEGARAGSRKTRSGPPEPVRRRDRGSRALEQSRAARPPPRRPARLAQAGPGAARPP